MGDYREACNSRATVATPARNLALTFVGGDGNGITQAALVCRHFRSPAHLLGGAEDAGWVAGLFSRIQPEPVLLRPA